MKLTDSQKRAMQAVACGKVTYFASLYIRKRGRISGYRGDVIQRLEKMGLVELVWDGAVRMMGEYKLTPEGIKALTTDVAREAMHD